MFDHKRPGACLWKIRLLHKYRRDLRSVHEKRAWNKHRNLPRTQTKLRRLPYRFLGILRGAATPHGEQPPRQKPPGVPSEVTHIQEPMDGRTDGRFGLQPSASQPPSPSAECHWDPIPPLRLIMTPPGSDHEEVRQLELLAAYGSAADQTPPTHPPTPSRHFLLLSVTTPERSERSPSWRDG